MSGGLHSARISDVERVLCGDGVGKIINFKLGGQKKKDVKFICHERGTILKEQVYS